MTLSEGSVGDGALVAARTRPARRTRLARRPRPARLLEDGGCPSLKASSAMVPW